MYNYNTLIPILITTFSYSIFEYNEHECLLFFCFRIGFIADLGWSLQRHRAAQVSCRLRVYLKFSGKDPAHYRHNTIGNPKQNQMTTF